MKKQKPKENLWEYESRLQADFKTAIINEEAPFVDFYKKGIYDSELRKLLLLHEPPLTTIVEVKTAVHLYQTRLLRLCSLRLQIGKRRQLSRFQNCSDNWLRVQTVKRAASTNGNERYHRIQ